MNAALGTALGAEKKKAVWALAPGADFRLPGEADWQQVKELRKDLGAIYVTCSSGATYYLGYYSPVEVRPR